MLDAKMRSDKFRTNGSHNIEDFKRPPNIVAKSRDLKYL